MMLRRFSLCALVLAVASVFGLTACSPPPAPDVPGVDAAFDSGPMLCQFITGTYTMTSSVGTTMGCGDGGTAPYPTTAIRVTVLASGVASVEFGGNSPGTGRRCTATPMDCRLVVSGCTGADAGMDPLDLNFNQDGATGNLTATANGCTSVYPVQLTRLTSTGSNGSYVNPMPGMTCTEFLGVQQAFLDRTHASCTGAGTAACMWRDAPCVRLNSIGGCTSPVNPGSTTIWYFPGAVREGITYNTEDDVRMNCGMATFVAP